MHGIERNIQGAAFFALILVFVLGLACGVLGKWACSTYEMDVAVSEKEAE